MDEKKVIELIKEANKIGLSGKRILDIVNVNNEYRLVTDQKEFDPYYVGLEDCG